MLRGEINSIMIMETMPEPLLHIVRYWKNYRLTQKPPDFQYEKN